MLLEIAIADFAIIDRLRVEFEPGFNVMTGETGAGKSIIIDALNGLLGARLGPESIRAGAEQSRLEAIFSLDGLGHAREIAADLEQELGIEVDDNQVIVTREIGRNRSVARINGRAVPLQALRRVGEWLVDVHGQGEHLSLLRPSQHVDFLDRYAGLLGQRALVADRVNRLNQVRREITTLTHDERELARRLDLLRFQVDEIEAAALEPGEEESLEAEERMLANAERLTELATLAYSVLSDPVDEERSAVDAVSAAAATVDELASLDESLGEVSASLQGVLDQVADAARAIRQYRDSIEINPERLVEVQERIELIRNLKRKYGGTIEEILQYRDESARDLDQISNAGERLAELRLEEEHLLAEIGEQAKLLSSKRSDAASSLAQAIERELNDLHMANTQFRVDIKQAEDPDGVPVDGRRLAFDQTGIDRVEFLIAPNPGEPLRSLVKVASGGETSRVMLALKGVLAGADLVPTLIFDEIDVGIGGRTGLVVGEKMWRLGSSHQVITVTHLPQTASYADAHYQISKHVHNGRTSTAVRRLEHGDRIEEIAQMLGGATETTRRSAAELLERANTRKAEQDSETVHNHATT